MTEPHEPLPPLTLDDVKAMTPEQQIERKAEVDQLLRHGTTYGAHTDWTRVDLAKLPEDVINDNWPKVSAELRRRGAAEGAPK